MNAPEPDQLPLGKILVVTMVTVAVFGAGIAVSGAVVAGHEPTSVPPPHDTVEHGLVWAAAPGLERDAAAPSRFGWVDRDAGVATLPIDRAIDVTLEQRR